MNPADVLKTTKSALESHQSHLEPLVAQISQLLQELSATTKQLPVDAWKRPRALAPAHLKGDRLAEFSVEVEQTLEEIEYAIEGIEMSSDPTMVDLEEISGNIDSLIFGLNSLEELLEDAAEAK